jgi:hypothetical protein
MAKKDLQTTFIQSIVPAAMDLRYGTTYSQPTAAIRRF